VAAPGTPCMKLSAAADCPPALLPAPWRVEQHHLLAEASTQQSPITVVLSCLPAGLHLLPSNRQQCLQHLRLGGRHQRAAGAGDRLLRLQCCPNGSVLPLLCGYGHRCRSVAWGWGRGGEGGQLVQLQLQVSHASSQPRRLQCCPGCALCQQLLLALRVCGQELVEQDQLSAICSRGIHHCTGKCSSSSRHCRFSCGCCLLWHRNLSTLAWRVLLRSCNRPSWVSCAVVYVSPRSLHQGATYTTNTCCCCVGCSILLLLLFGRHLLFW